MGHYHDVAAVLRTPTRDLRKAIPDTWAGFAAMHKSAMADGAGNVGQLDPVCALATSAL